MFPKAPALDITYKQYLDQIARIDLKPLEEKLGVRVENDEVVIPFLGTQYFVSGRGINDSSGKQPPLEISVVLCQYLLLCPDVSPAEDDWVAYRDFKDAGPLTTFFANNVEKPIADHFAGRLSELEETCAEFGGSHPELELAYDLSTQFLPLPQIPILLLYNDADDEFPAHCSMLFERRADKYLDAESLAILASILAGFLTRKPPRYEGF